MDWFLYDRELRQKRLVFSNVENIGSVTSVSTREKVSAIKKFINCPNAVKMYNVNCTDIFPDSQSTKRNSINDPDTNPPSYLPIFTKRRNRFVVYIKKGIESKQSSSYTICKVPLCIIKRKNCFVEHHE